MNDQDIFERFEPLKHTKLSYDDKLELLSRLRRETANESLSPKRQRRVDASRWTRGSAAATSGVAVATAAIVTGFIVYSHNQFGRPTLPTQGHGRVQTAATTTTPSKPSAKPLDGPTGTSLITHSLPYLVDMRMVFGDNGRMGKDGWAWGYPDQHFQLVKTDTGGQSWQTVKLPVDFPAYDPKFGPRGEGSVHPFFFDSQNGIVVRLDTAKAQMLVVRTLDGGTHWDTSSITVPRDASVVGSIDFVKPDSGWIMLIGSPGAGSAGKYLYHTDDGGATWQQVSDSEHGVPYGGMQTDMYFRNRTVGWLAVGNPAANAISLSQTTDGGHSWTDRSGGLNTPTHVGTLTLYGAATAYAPVFSPSLQEAVLMATMAADDQGHAVRVPLFQRSQDGGLTWSSPTIPSSLEGASVDLSGRPAAFAQTSVTDGWTIAQGKFYRTTDGGQTWSLLDSPTLTQPLKAYDVVAQMWFVTKDIGWVLLQQSNGGASIFLSTTDGGQTWVDGAK